MRSVWAVFVLLAWVGGGLIVPPPVRAHEAASLEEEFVKGVFSPAFTPPAAGSYELPAVKRVPGVTLQDLQAKLKEEGLGRHAILLSISFDPERDTPAQLAKYARIYGADPKLWRFMTASSERVLDHALEGYGQDRAPVYDERGRFTGRYRHVLKVFLLDPAGYIRNVYSAGFLVPDLVLNDIKTILGEGAPREVVER